MASSQSGYLPRTDAALLAWAQHFHSVLAAAPVTYGTNAGDVEALNDYVVDFQAKLALVDPVIRSKTSVAAKNTSRATMKTYIQQLAKTVYGTAGLSDAQIIEVGLTVRKNPTPIPVPTSAPALTLVSVSGNVVRLRVEDSQVGKKGKAENAKGAAIYVFIGETPAESPSSWTLFGNSTRVDFELGFPGTVEAGSRVWITAAWFNPRNLQGPLCTPISTLLLGAPEANVPGGNMKIAA